MGRFGVTPMFGLNFFMWSLLALANLDHPGPMFLAALSGILVGLPVGILYAKYRLRQLEAKGEIRLTYQAIIPVILGIALILNLDPFMSSLQLNTVFAIVGAIYVAGACAWGLIWLSFRSWERKSHKQIVSGGLLSTRIFAEDISR